MCLRWRKKWTASSPSAAAKFSTGISDPTVSFFPSAKNGAMTGSTHLTKVYIHLDRLAANLRLLQELAGGRPLWPAVKADAYGHGLAIIARHLIRLGCDTLCVAHVGEAVALRREGIKARVLLLSATSPAHSQAIIAAGCEPAVCTFEMAEALNRDAGKLDRTVSVHLVIDTGMGRIGIRPDEVDGFLQRISSLPRLRLRGIMSHFPGADQRDKTSSNRQIARFREVVRVAAPYGIRYCHLANSAAIFDLPHAGFDAVRPGIAVYGLPPSAEIINPRVRELKPVCEWKTRITFLKEVPAGTGLSYGHIFRTSQASLIATIPVGYGDGLSRRLSNNLEFLVGDRRCPQVGRITMDQSLIDVTALRGRVKPDDEVVIIGCQGNEEVTADEIAARLGTINYEVVTRISARVPRIAVESAGTEKS